MSRANTSRKAERVLLRKGISIGEKQQIRNGELLLYFGTSDRAAEARRVLVHNHIACEQFQTRVTVYLEAQEEKIA